MNSTEQIASAQIAPDMVRLTKDSQQLARMEQAAQASANPKDIRECKAPQRQPASHADKVWLTALGGALLLLLAAHFFLNWRSAFISDDLLPRVQNYIRGAALVAGIILIARLLEVLAISRVGNAVNRYNLKRILRLIVVLAVAFTVVSVLFV